MDFELDRAIAVRPRGEGSYETDLDGRWVVGGGVNGGYLLALIGHAVSTELAAEAHPDPVSVSAYFLTPSVAGPAVVRVRRLRVGGRRTTVTASLVQQSDGQEVERMTVLAVFGRLPEDADAPDDPDALDDPGALDDRGVPSALARQPEPPGLPPLEECIEPRVVAPPEFLRVSPLLERFGTRLDPTHAGWMLGEPNRTGVVQGWFRLADERPLDPVALLLAVDALPPVTLNLGLPGWAPTLELTAYVRGRPAPGWAVVRHATRTVSGGLFEEDCEVWDSRGVLVAQSRQLALLPRPPRA